MSVPNPATTDWVPLYAGGSGLAYKQDWSGATTYNDGDVVIKDGIAYLCVGGPTTVAPDILPWGAPSPNRPAQELAYAEQTADLSVTATTEATAQTCVTAPPVTVDGGTAIVIEFFSPLAASAPAAGAALVFWLYDGAVSLGRIGYVSTPAAANMYVPARLARRLIPAAGTHTYSIRANVTTGTGIVQGQAGGPATPVPAFIRVAQANPQLILPSTITPPTYGTTLPASPADGQEAVLVDSITNPTFSWRFRYNAGSSGPYKWEFIGGPPAYNEDISPGNATSTTFAALPAVADPTIVIPRTGAYIVGLGAQVSGSGTIRMGFSFAIGAAAALDTDGTSTVGTAAAEVHTFRERYRGLTAGDILSMKYKTNSGTATFAHRFLRVTPRNVA